MTSWRAILATGVIGTAIAATGTPAAHAETVLRFNNVLPPTHIIRTQGWDVWAKQVAEATNGRVKIEMTTKALGILPRAFDLARDGVADVTWGVQGYTPGRFVSAEIAELPFLSPTGEALSVAYWRVYKKHFEKANEYRGVKLLGLHTHSPGHVFTATKPLTKMADLKGLKIRIVNRSTSDVLKAFGGAPVREPAPKLSQLLSKGVVDGTFFTADGISSFRLGGKLNNWLRFQDGLYNTSFFLVMNQTKWDAIPAADRTAIERVSGENFARIMGALWDRSEAEGAALLKKTGAKIAEPSDADMAKLKAKAALFETTWLKKVKAKGIDGAAALKMLRAEVAAYKAK